MRMMIKFLKEEEAQFSMRKSIEFAQKYWFGVVGAVVLPFASMADTACPAGMVPYQGPVVTQMENSSGECADLCDSGVRAIMMGDGSKRIDLFKVASTDKKLATKYNDQICYSDIVPGTKSGALNVDIDGNAYYVYPSKWQICPPRYTLSYDCGDADSGTIAADQNQIVTYGQVYSAGYPETTCFKKGHYIHSWKIGDATIMPYDYSIWKWDSDQVAVAQWRQRTYYGVYLCNLCQSPYVTRANASDVSIQGIVGDTYTLIAPNLEKGPYCNIPDGAEFVGYEVYDAYTNDTTGTVIPADNLTFTWEWDYSVSFRALWEWDYVSTKYTLSYSCGVDAAGNDVPGTPPADKEVDYNGLFSLGWDVGTCSYPGYQVSAWKIGSSNYNPIGFNTWTALGNQVATAVWSAKRFYAPYFCNNGAQTSSVLSATYNATVTPSKTVCAAPEGKVLKGYDLYDTTGTVTDVFVPAGSSFTYSYLTNMSLHAVWVDAE